MVLFVCLVFLAENVLSAHELQLGNPVCCPCSLKESTDLPPAAGTGRIKK